VLKLLAQAVTGFRAASRRHRLRGADCASAPSLCSRPQAVFFEGGC